MQEVDQIPPARHPEIVYWFWQNNTLANQQYLNDVRKMASQSPYTIAFFTARDNLNFYDFNKFHDPFAKTVAEAHKHHLKIGLQLWDFGNPFQAVMPSDGKPISAGENLPLDKAIALVSEGEVVLNAGGHADYAVTCTDGRANHPFHSDILKVFAFHKTADGYYADGSLADITDSAHATQATDGGAHVSIAAPAKLAGYTAYIMVAHYFNAPDLFNNVMIDTFRDALRHYSDIPFDGTALDEFGYLLVTHAANQPFRDRFYGKAMAVEYLKRTGVPLERALLDMRYAPDGKPAIRIATIDQYFDLLRQGPLRVEEAFYRMSKEIFGPNTFAGFHDTFHNTMHTDDLWRVGFNWWQIPREYGQSDENWGMPQRMGLIMVHPEPIAIDMFYSRSPASFTQKALREARFGGRTNYHGWNDYSGRWGIDLSDTDKYKTLTQAEMKIRLLNHFDPPAPKLSVLVVFGMPALINWFPDEKSRNPWDIDGSLGIEEKAAAIWNANYPCALLPSDFIDSGQITFDAGGHPVINGHHFDCLVYLYPQYAKETTLRFLEKYAQAGGKLMLVGDADHDFLGHDIAGRFAKIAALATSRAFDLKQLDKIGAKKNPLADGAYMENGSVILTDFRSFRRNQPKSFSLTLNHHTFAGKYVGVCAIKADDAGNLEKLACGSFTEIRRDGQVIFSLPHPRDVIIWRQSSGKYQVLAAK